MDQKQIIKQLKSEVKYLRSDRDYWKERFNNQYNKNCLLMDWVKIKFNWWVELIGNQEKPSLKYLITDTHELLLKYQSLKA